MSDLLIKNLGTDLRQRIARQATLHRRSLEEEARALLDAATAHEPAKQAENIVAAARRIFGAANGFDLELPPRGAAPEKPPPTF